MKTIHFHVGSGRCGSTLIQALFNEPAMHQVFGQYNIKYAPEVCMALGPLTPVEEFREADWHDFRAEHFAPLKTVAEDNIFLTQENIFGVHWEKGSRNRCDASCALIRHLTEGFDVKIVILVRRQDTFLESLYNQLIKRWETRAFSEFLGAIELDNLDWAAVADTYATAFGRDNVTVLPFERPVLQTGDDASFFEAVLRVIGINAKINFENVPTINPSLSTRALEIQRLANQLLTRDEAHGLANWFEANVPKAPGDPHSIMDEADRTRLLQRFQSSNKRLCETYLEGYDTGYYLAPVN